jgi:hypothetical protein
LSKLLNNWTYLALGDMKFRLLFSLNTRSFEEEEEEEEEEKQKLQGTL